MYKIRIISDTKEDVIRTVLVAPTISLEDLHFFIATSFGFGGQEMASFYKTDKNWSQGQEIPLFAMDEAGAGVSMSTYTLNKTLPKVNDKLIYVYDFLNMWTFYVEVIEISDQIAEGLPKVILSVGEIPDKAPEKEFKADFFNQDPEDPDSDFNHFDDFDFNEY